LGSPKQICGSVHREYLDTPESDETHINGAYKNNITKPKGQLPVREISKAQVWVNEVASLGSCCK